MRTDPSQDANGLERTRGADRASRTGAHRRAKPGEERSVERVAVCKDCGEVFEYGVDEMRKKGKQDCSGVALLSSLLRGRSRIESSWRMNDATVGSRAALALPPARTSFTSQARFRLITRASGLGLALLHSPFGPGPSGATQEPIRAQPRALQPMKCRERSGAGGAGPAQEGAKGPVAIATATVSQTIRPPAGSSQSRRQCTPSNHTVDDNVRHVYPVRSRRVLC